jgi:hypothetical protein
LSLDQKSVPLNPTIRDQDFFRIFSPEGILINDVYPGTRLYAYRKLSDVSSLGTNFCSKEPTLKIIDVNFIFLSSFASFFSFYFLFIENIPIKKEFLIQLSVVMRFFWKCGHNLIIFGASSPRHTGYARL